MRLSLAMLLAATAYTRALISGIVAVVAVSKHPSSSLDAATTAQVRAQVRRVQVRRAEGGTGRLRPDNPSVGADREGRGQTGRTGGGDEGGHPRRSIDE